MGLAAVKRPRRLMLQISKAVYSPGNSCQGEQIVSLTRQRWRRSVSMGPGGSKERARATGLDTSRPKAKQMHELGLSGTMLDYHDHDRARNLILAPRGTPCD